MRILVAPGPFGSSLPAPEAAAAIADGWNRTAPNDDLILAPLSDGGSGYVDALSVTLGGERLTVPALDAHGRPAAAPMLVVASTAYAETAPLLDSAAIGAGDVAKATTSGVGTLVAYAIGLGATAIRLGVSASGVTTNDGGAGMLAALGANAVPDASLGCGYAALESLTTVDVTAALSLLSGVDLTVVSDDTTQLIGLLGTTVAAGAARGIAQEELPAVDAALQHYAAAAAGTRVATLRGAGAGGGIGFAAVALGGRVFGGTQSVLDDIRLAALAAPADLVLTGAQALDPLTGGHQLASAVAEVCAAAVRPCVALAQRVEMGSREVRALGVESAYAVEDLVEPSGDEAEDLARLAARVARTWSWTR